MFGCAWECAQKISHLQVTNPYTAQAQINDSKRPKGRVRNDVLWHTRSRKCTRGTSNGINIRVKTFQMTKTN